MAITTDVLVGFPGETEAEFQESLEFVRRMAFSRLHVFRYSPRPGTPAVRLAGQVHPRLAQERSDALIALGHDLSRRFHERFLGRRLQVLFESAEEGCDPPLWSGCTDHYVRVQAPSHENLHNRFAFVCPTKADQEGLCGEILP
ncbi:MAG: hypothetical protein H5T69_11685 [Chloroflexi bacterium]|nr:hypothetical protein [Chloroflexota bacterium]